MKRVVEQVFEGYTYGKEKGTREIGVQGSAAYAIFENDKIKQNKMGFSDIDFYIRVLNEDDLSIIEGELVELGKKITGGEQGLRWKGGKFDLQKRSLKYFEEGVNILMNINCFDGTELIDFFDLDFFIFKNGEKRFPGIVTSTIESLYIPFDGNKDFTLRVKEEFSLDFETENGVELDIRTITDLHNKKTIGVMPTFRKLVSQLNNFGFDFDFDKRFLIEQRQKKTRGFLNNHKDWKIKV
jgi:hypothetical protein